MTKDSDLRSIKIHYVVSQSPLLETGKDILSLNGCAISPPQIFNTHKYDPLTCLLPSILI